MTGNVQDTTGEQLTLQSRMSELAQVPPWIESIATRYTISASTEFAMNLCLEEALSNIIRHGYRGKPDHSISVHFASPRENYFIFDVEDEAPPFNPMDSPELPPISSLDEIQIGGQGIRLLRQFASELKYQATPTGNRLSIGFSSSSAVTKG